LGEHAFDFVVVEEGDLFFEGFGEIDEGWIEAGDFAAGEVSEEAAEGDKVVSLSQRREFLVLVVFETIEPEAIAAEEFFGDVFGFELRAGEVEEAAQIEVVVARGVDGAAFFNLEVLDELGY